MGEPKLLSQSHVEDTGSLSRTVNTRAQQTVKAAGEFTGAQGESWLSPPMHAARNAAVRASYGLYAHCATRGTNGVYGCRSPLAKLFISNHPDGLIKFASLIPRGALLPFLSS